MLFNKSDQTMEYFRKRKDISFSKLEILADFFNKPLEYFRQDSSFIADDRNYGNNYVGNIYINSDTNLMAENEMLRKKVSSLETAIDEKDKAIKELDEIYSEKKLELIVLKAQLRMLNQG
jgi:hypothetical protein